MLADKEKLLDKNKPWMHPGLIYLICEQFWSVKGDAIKMGKQNNLYLEFPKCHLVLDTMHSQRVRAKWQAQRSWIGCSLYR